MVSMVWICNARVSERGRRKEDEGGGGGRGGRGRGVVVGERLVLVGRDCSLQPVERAYFFN